MKTGLLIYGPLDTLSGGYLYDRKLVEYLRAHGDEVEIISLPWRSYPLHLLDNLSFRLPSKLDILIEDELNHPSLLGANARRGAYPVVSLVHHLRSSEQHPEWLMPLYRRVERRYLNSVDGFIFNSETTRKVVSGLAGEKVPSLTAFPPTDRFGAGRPEQEVLARASEKGPLRLAFLGNVIPRKGLETVLSALKLLPEGFTLDVIGSLEMDRAHAKRMQKMTQAAGLAQRVIFHGALDAQALAAMLSQAQVLVVPSSYEGFGIVYLEGMAFGLPAIGSTAGAAGELIKDGETGYLVRAGDAESLARRLDGLAQDRDLLGSMSLKALRRYRQQPTWEQTAANIRQFLRALVISPATSRVKPA
ncbi:MAG TPA: glycosyltransferase family 4 protein [Anaerolineales bacterium]|jgi:glycosyltransferase involved in cell wall biosynthesis